MRFFVFVLSVWFFLGVFLGLCVCLFCLLFCLCVFCVFYFALLFFKAVIVVANMLPLRQKFFLLYLSMLIYT